MSSLSFLSVLVLGIVVNGEEHTLLRGVQNRKLQTCPEVMPLFGQDTSCRDNGLVCNYNLMTVCQDGTELFEHECECAFDNWQCLANSLAVCPEEPQETGGDSTVIAATCPNEQPAAGSTCSSSDDTLSCQYNLIEHCGNDIYIVNCACSFGEWWCASLALMPCPEEPEPTGSEEPEPTGPACTVCTDNPPNDNKACDSNLSTLTRNCNQHNRWIENKFCQNSCFSIGLGYDGDECCGDAETTV